MKQRFIVDIEQTEPNRDGIKQKIWNLKWADNFIGLLKSDVLELPDSVESLNSTSS